MPISAKQLLLCLLVLLYVLPSKGQDTRAQPLTPEAWQVLTSDKAFSYKDQKEAKKLPQKEQKENPLSKAMAQLLQFFSSPTGKTLVWLSLIAFVVFVVVKVVLGNNSTLFRKQPRKLVAEKADHGEQPSDVHGTDWAQLFAQSMELGNQRLAVRYSFMHMLQVLEQHRCISFRTDKTNHDYYYELKDQELRTLFRSLANQYEYAWYGEYTLSDTALKAYLHTYNTLKSTLG